MRFVPTIGLTAEALGYYVLKEAPRVTRERLMSNLGIYAPLRRRLLEYWPEHHL
jgi:hypothetical protein